MALNKWGRGSSKSNALAHIIMYTIHRISASYLSLLPPSPSPHSLSTSVTHILPSILVPGMVILLARPGGLLTSMAADYHDLYFPMTILRSIKLHKPSYVSKQWNQRLRLSCLLSDESSVGSEIGYTEAGSLLKRDGGWDERECTHGISNAVFRARTHNSARCEHRIARFKLGHSSSNWMDDS